MNDCNTCAHQDAPCASEPCNSCLDTKGGFPGWQAITPPEILVLPAPPGWTMSDRSDKPYAAFKAAGWTDDQLKQHGYLVVQAAPPDDDDDLLNSVMDGLLQGHGASEDHKVADAALRKAGFTDKIIERMKWKICDQNNDVRIAALKTLTQLGYTYRGGELWEPPLGGHPDTVRLDWMIPIINGGDDLGRTEALMRALLEGMEGRAALDWARGVS